jgi:integrase/recombinase XerD
MQIQFTQFDELKRYLVYDRKIKDTKKNILVLESRFRILCAFFVEKEFTRANFISFLEYMREKGYSTAYCNQFIKMAKHIDKFYKLEELQDFTQYKKEKHTVDILTDQEMLDLAEVRLPYTRNLEETNGRYRALIYVMYYTGARINEIISLRWEDVWVDPVPLLVFNQTKINEMRYAPIPVTLYDDLRALPHFSGYIFTNREGHPLDITTVNYTLKKRAVAIGLKKRVYNHLFRHSFINLMLRGGAKIHEVSRLVGHKSIETTNAHYVHVMVEELNDVLHSYHPALKKSQNIDILTKRVREFCANILDTERFDLRISREKKSVSFEIKELE